MSDPAPDPVAVHKETCAACRDVSPCARLRDLRRAARVAALNHGAANCAPAGDQITTTPATG